MDKKKIMGMILFTFLLMFFLSLPVIKENVFNYRINYLLKSNEVEKVYDVLSTREIENYHWAQATLLSVKYQLDYYIGEDIEDLVNANSLATLQFLVDDYPEIIESYLSKLASVEDLVLPQGKQERGQYIQAMNYLKPYIDYPYSKGYGDALKKAMVVRGEKEVDNIYIRSLLYNGETEQAIEYYPYLKPEYVEDAQLAFAQNLGMGAVRNIYSDEIMNYDLEQIIENISYLETLDLPDDLLQPIMRELAFNSLLYRDEIRGLKFIKENIYFEYYIKLSNIIGRNFTEKNYSEHLAELKDMEEFYQIDQFNTMVEVLEGNQEIYAFYEVTKDREVLIRNYDNFIVYSIVDNEVRDLMYNVLDIVSTSPGRDFYLLTILDINENEDYDVSYIIVDSEFQIVFENVVEGVGYLDTTRWRWIDNYTIVINDKKFDCLTGEISQQEGKIESVALKGPGQYDLYLVSDETYTILEYTEFWDEGFRNKEYTHYTIRDINNHKSLVRIPLNNYDGFFGSCDNYLYVGRKIDNTLLVIEAINKETMEKKLLPFYSWYYFSYSQLR